jgi:hypothetical protein
MFPQNKISDALKSEKSIKIRRKEGEGEGGKLFLNIRTDSLEIRSIVVIETWNFEFANLLIHWIKHHALEVLAIKVRNIK